MSKWIKLSETIEKVIDYRGKTPKKLGGDWSKDGYRALSALNVKTSGLSNLDNIKFLDSKLYKLWMKEEVEKGDLLLTSEAPAGQVLIWESDERIVLSQRLFALRINKEHNNYFIKYFLQSDLGQKEIFKNTSGSTVFGISAKMFDLISLPFYKKDTQIKIGKCLRSLDAKIELNNKINAELETMTKTLYDYWFVQFDFPFDFAQGRPDANGKPYKSSGGKMVWNEELKREIPEGWGVDTVDAYAEVKKGDLITAKDSEEGNVKVVAAGVSYSYLHSTANRDKNTITISGSGANAGYINFWREPIFASDCITVRGKNDTITLMILHHLRLIQNYILSQATGSAQPHVYPTDIKILKYAVPPNHLIEQFGNIVLPMNDKIANNLKENQHLTSFRDWLLPMLMNGQVTVVDALRQAQDDELGMVAEPKSDYKSSNDTFNEIFNQLNYDYEIAAVVSLTFQRFKCYYGKKYIHKMFSNIQMLNTLPVFKELTFQENGWGMFSPQIKKAIEDQKFVKFGEIKDNQKVLEVNIKYLKEIGNWIKDEENKAFVSQVNDMLTIYESPTINKKMDNIELFNTVLECMKVLKTDNFEAIYDKMKAWPMKEEGYETKADKFTKMQTKGMILFIKEIKK